MDIEQVALKLQETTDRSLRNEGRIEKLEDENSVLHQLATSVAVLAEQMRTMNKNVTTLTTEVEELRGRPAKKWDGLVSAVIAALAAAVIGFLVGQL
jgi:hypothetical protein